MLRLDRRADEILERVRKYGCVLMLDFDGVLAPLVADSYRARMSAGTREILKACAERMPVAIITGRALTDIEKRVALKGISYAGSHGLEWKLGGKRKRRSLPARFATQYANARAALLKVARVFRNVRVEDKRFCLALGYRLLARSRAREFLSQAHAAMAEHIQTGRIRLIDDAKTLELMAATEWSKGECADRIFRSFRLPNAVPIYIGDALTDETAFRIFRRGITVRVGRSHDSSARYYVSQRRDVDQFLKLVLRALT